MKKITNYDDEQEKLTFEVMSWNFQTKLCYKT